MRVLVIGLGAFVGARWLATPMRRLAAAAQSLSRGQRPAPLDEDTGTYEVRQTAQVSNAMARRLHAQFDERGLVIAAFSHDLRTPMTWLRLRLEASRGREGGGVGLGLYIARDLTECQGGRLVLLNHRPGGLRAELTLPAA